MTLTTEQFIEDFLCHQYDPQKSHDYYERTKQLKGRKKGSGRQLKGRQPHVSPEAAHKKMIAARTQKRLAELKSRLAELEKVLDRLVKEAKGRNKSSATSKAPVKKASPTRTAKGSGGSNSKSKPLTASQKADARKRSEEYRKKHPTAKDPNKEVVSAEKKIKEVRKQIAAIRAQLQKAVDRARKDLTSSGK